MKLLSVVIPFFNEGGNVRSVLAELAGVLKKEGMRFEIVAVDDGSEDATWLELSSMRSIVPELHLLRMRKNFGQTRALAAGIAVARGDWILTMDGDGQNDPESLRLLVDRTGGKADVVSGWRKNRKDAALRSLLSRMANRLLSLITGLRLHDSGCSLKLYRASALRSISLYSDRHRFLPFLLAMRGFRIEEVAVSHRARMAGHSKYGYSRTLKVLLDLIALTLFAKFKMNPRLYFFLGAAPFLALTFLFIFISVGQTAGLVGVEGMVVYTGAAVLFCFGAISLICYGLMAEWMFHYERGAKDNGS